MKKILFVLLAIVGLSFKTTKQPNESAVQGVLIKQYPAKTIILKDSRFVDSKTYFQNIKNLTFEVYQLSAVEISTLVKQFKNESATESIELGTKTNVYQQLILSLKTPQNKKWFVKQLKSAGLTHILINHDEVKPLADF